MKKRNLHKIFICLIGFFVTARAQSQNSFAYKARLENVSGTKLYKIDLPPQVVAKCKDNFADLRIFDEEGEPVSYILENDLPVFKKENFTEFPIIKVSKEKDKQTHVIIQNTMGSTINNLLLFIKNMDASRSFSLTGSDDSIHWFIIRENIYLENAFSSDRDNIIDIFSFPKSSYKYLQLIILGENVIPVNIVKAGVYKEDLVYGKYTELPQPFITQKDSSNKKSYVFLKFDDLYQINKIIVEAAGPKYFRRSFTVSEGDKDKYDYLLKDYLISDSLNRFIINGKDNNLLLIIKNEDDIPLKVKAAKSFQLNIKMFTYLQANKRYVLYFGDSTSQLPKYDLQFFKDSIEKDAADLSLNAIEKNHPGNNKITPASPETGKLMLWVILAGILSILCFFTFRMTREIDKKRGSDQ